MRLDDGSEPLSPEALALVRAMASAAPGEPLATEEAMIRLAVGLAEGEEANATLAAITASEETRRRFADVRREVLAASSRQPAAPAILAALRLSTRHAHDELVALTHVAIPSWDTFVEAAGTLVRASLQQLGQALSLSHAGPTFSLTRDGEASARFELAEEVIAELAVNLVESDLVVTVVLELPSEQAFDRIRGSNLKLLLRDPAGGILPIHTMVVTAKQFTHTLPAFLEVFDLDASVLSASDFLLTLDNPASLAMPKRFLYIDVPPPIVRDDLTPIPVELSAPPLVREGNLILELSAPAEALAVYREYSITVTVGGGGVALEVGSIPLSRFSGGQYQAVFPLPELPDKELPLGSLVQLGIKSESV